MKTKLLSEIDEWFDPEVLQPTSHLKTVFCLHKVLFIHPLLTELITYVYCRRYRSFPVLLVPV